MFMICLINIKSMSIQNKHLYLIDGSGYIFRAYYALPPLTRKSDGLPVGAVSGFCNMLQKFLEQARNDTTDQKPSHIAVIFDSARKNFRNEIYKEYKANREDAPEDLIPQFDYIRKAVNAFNLPSIEMQGFEADDIIATFKNSAKKKKIKVTIISSDKDLMQLVDDQTNMFDPMKEKLIGPKEVEEKFGVTPDKVIDVQSLAGDSVDNIPGVPGIGIKTAAELINKFKDLDGLLKNIDKIKQPKRRQTLNDNKDKAIISKKLVTLDENVPIKNKIEDLILKPQNTKKLSDFLQEMEFSRLYKKISSSSNDINQTLNDIKKAETKTQKGKNNYNIILKIDDLKKYLRVCEDRGFFVIDVETNSLNVETAELVGLSISCKEFEAIYVPLNHKSKNDKLIKSQLSRDDVINILKPYLEDEEIIKIGQNFKFDFKIFNKFGVNVRSIEDTMLQSYSLDAGKNRHNMDLLSDLHLSHKTIKFKDIVGTGKSEITFDYVPIDIASEYACEDADITLRLYNIFKERLFKEKVLSVYENLEKPMIKILARMELAGIKIDTNILNDLSNNFKKDLSQIEKKIFKISGEKFNIGSTKQLGDILYQKLKISGTKKTKKGNFATNVSVLEDLANKGHEFPNLVLQWRQKSKLKSTYTDALPEYVDDSSKRVHTSFLLAATNTGRLASAEPNLQNIPIKTNEGKLIRSAFVSEKGYQLISADYSQIEMRVLAHMADVKELKTAFKNKEDIHNITAGQIFSKKPDEINEDMRRKAKAINFGIIYGISAYGLAKQISVSNSEADEFLTSYFKKFPEIKSYMNETLKFCKKHGYIKTLFDRKCHFQGINDKNHTIRSFQERAAINAPIQGTAADILRFAMIKIDKKINKKIINAKLLVQIHDELLFEVKSSNTSEVSKLVVQQMEHATEPEIKFSVPLIVDINSGKNWNEAH